MSDVKVYDSSGDWFMNTGSFRMVDPTSNAIFEPGVPTRATSTAWLVGEKGNDNLPGQVVIKSIKDPFAPEVVEEAKVVKATASIAKNGPPPEPKKDE